MRLLTHNMQACNIKGVTNGFPFRVEAEEVMEKQVDFNADFLRNLFPKIEWKALVEASRAMGYHELPDEADSSLLDSDDFLQKFHRALPQLHLEEGAFVCPETGRKFPVNKGIPNVLLHEDKKLQHNSRKCSRTPSCMGKIVTAFLFFILFFRVTVYSLTFNTSMTLSLEREFPHDTVDLTQLHLLDTARHIRFKVPQFGVGGNADRHIAGLYFTSVRLGTPPKEYILQIDTGSSLTWIYCTGCVGCSTRNLLRAPHDFNPKNSITSSEVDCTAQVCSLVHKILGGECLKSNWCSFDAMYGGGALASMLSGYLLTDQMKLAATLENASKIISSVPITFGCGFNISGLLSTSHGRIDGILGLGPQDFSIVSQLASTGEMPWVFSECLRSEGDGGGFLIFGEVINHTLMYTPLLPSKRHYMIALTSIALNGQVLPIDPAFFDDKKSGVMIDSGTTLAYVVDDFYHIFADAVNLIASQARIPRQSEEDLCYWMPTSKMKIFPTITFNFVGGPSMTIQPKDYFIRGDVLNLNAWCIGIRKTFYRDVNIFGDLILKDRLIVYDLAANRLGWTDYNCSSPVQISFDKSKTQRGGGNKKPCMIMGKLVLLYIIVLLYTQNNV